MLWLFLFFGRNFFLFWNWCNIWIWFPFQIRFINSLLLFVTYNTLAFLKNPLLLTFFLFYPFSILFLNKIFLDSTSSWYRTHCFRCYFCFLKFFFHILLHVFLAFQNILPVLKHFLSCIWWAIIFSHIRICSLCLSIIFRIRINI